MNDSDNLSSAAQALSANNQPVKQMIACFLSRGSFARFHQVIQNARQDIAVEKNYRLPFL